MQIFETDIIKEENSNITFIQVPFNAKEIFSISKGTIYVKGKINDMEYRSKLLSRGKGVYVLVLNKGLQKLIGFTGNKMSVKVTMSLEQENLKNKYMEEVEVASTHIDVITAIKNRQSIRKFTKEPIDNKTLNTILYAGLQAPTAKNKRPYHFVVIKDRTVMENFAEHNSNAKMLACASCAIIVCGDKNIEGMKEFLFADCAAASQNILLCTHGMGIGAVWCGITMNSDWKKVIAQEIHLPLKVEPISVIALGYPDETKEIQERWDNEKIHFNKW